MEGREMANLENKTTIQQSIESGTNLDKTCSRIKGTATACARSGKELSSVNKSQKSTQLEAPTTEELSITKRFGQLVNEMGTKTSSWIDKQVQQKNQQGGWTNYLKDKASRAATQTYQSAKKTTTSFFKEVSRIKQEEGFIAYTANSIKSAATSFANTAYNSVVGLKDFVAQEFKQVRNLGITSYIRSVPGRVTSTFTSTLKAMVGVLNKPDPKASALASFANAIAEAAEKEERFSHFNNTSLSKKSKHSAFGPTKAEQENGSWYSLNNTSLNNGPNSQNPNAESNTPDAIPTVTEIVAASANLSPDELARLGDRGIEIAAQPNGGSDLVRLKEAFKGDEHSLVHDLDLKESRFAALNKPSKPKLEAKEDLDSELDIQLLS